MKRNRRYVGIIFSILITILLVSTVFLGFGPDNSEKTETLVTGEIPEIDKNQQENSSTATFATRCFWGPDARLGVAEGVIRTRVGYLEVNGSVLDESGLKREGVQVDYDSEKVSYTELRDMVSQTGQLKIYPPTGKFLPAGRYDQSYRIGQHDGLSEGFKTIYSDIDDFVNSTAVARINGYLTGYGELDSPGELEGLGLTEKGMQEVYDIWKSREID